MWNGLSHLLFILPFSSFSCYSSVVVMCYVGCSFSVELLSDVRSWAMNIEWFEPRSFHLVLLFSSFVLWLFFLLGATRPQVMGRGESRRKNK